MTVAYLAAYLAILSFYGWLMISRRMTATIAIPLCALSIAGFALAPTAAAEGMLPYLGGIMDQVLEPGISMLSAWVFAVILGAVLASQMRISGAAERLVRYTAEYGGEDRFRLGLTMLVVIAILFTTLGGLGAVILVASICLPVMFSLGIDRKVAGGIFLLGLSLGGALNPANWQGYQQVLASEGVPEALRLDLGNVMSFAIAMAVLFLLVAVGFILRFLSSGHNALRNILGLLIATILLGMSAWLVFTNPAATQTAMLVAHHLLVAALIFLVLLLAIRTLQVITGGKANSWSTRTDNWLAAASLLVPILLLLWSFINGKLTEASGGSGISIGILPALFIGIVFCSLASLTRSGKTMNQLMQALFEGVQLAAPAVILLVGIGILLKATRLEPVTESFAPVFSSLPVGSAVAYVGTFFLLSPLALYRGPLNLYGMGIGIMGILSGAGVLHGSLIMAAFFSVGMLQGVCDPTNTHNVWIANFCKVPVNELTRLLFPWVSIIVLLGLAAGAVMFQSDFAGIQAQPVP